MLIALAFVLATLLLGVFLGRRLFDKNLALYAIPVGWVFATWILFALSLAIGFSELTIVLVCILIGLYCFFDYRANALDFTHLSNTSKSLLPLLVVALFSFLLLHASLLAFDSKGQLVGNGLDVGFYLSMTSSMAHGNFPPQYPIMSGEPLSYYYFPFFYSAALVKGGMPLLWAFNAFSVLVWVALIGMLFRIAHKLTESEPAAYLAVLLFLFCGGLAFAVHLSGFDFTNSKSVEALLSNPKFFLQYRSYGFPVTNLFTTGLVTRPDVAGLAVFLCAVVFAFLSKQRSVLSMALAGLFFGLSGMFNFPLALVTVSFLGIYFLLAQPPKHSWLHWRGWPLLGGALLGLALQIPIYSQKITATVTSTSIWQPFWFLSGTPFADPVQFWLANLGGFLVLGLAGWFFAPRALRTIALALVPTFIFLNLFQIFPWPVDSFKLIGPIFVGLILLTVVALRKIWHVPLLGKPAFFALLIPLTLTGYLSVMSMVHWTAVDASQNPLCTADDVALAQFVEANTPSKSVFLADPQAQVTCLVALSGRLSYSSNDHWIENHGFDLADRNQLLERMLVGDCALIRREGAAYALEDLRHGWKIPDTLKSESVQIWSQGGLSVYRITGC